MFLGQIEGLTADPDHRNFPVPVVAATACLLSLPLFGLYLFICRVSAVLFSLAVAPSGRLFFRQPTASSKNLCQDAWAIFIPAIGYWGVAGRGGRVAEEEGFRGFYFE